MDFKGTINGPYDNEMPGPPILKLSSPYPTPLRDTQIDNGREDSPLQTYI